MTMEILRLRSRMFAFLLGGMLVTAASGCFHKDVMTDTADDVEATLLYEGPGGPCIITKEEIFEATSKSSGGGVTHISGYSELRLSSYSLATGELQGRVELGEMQEEAQALLGYSPGKIWMFSILPELGLHYRDPVTMEVKESWESLKQKPGLSAFKPAKPDWPLIWEYFAYDWRKDRLLITDESGFKYALDPNTFALQKVEEEQLPRVEWDGHLTGRNGQFKQSEYINLEGEPRVSIKIAGVESPSEPSFLDGEWILDLSPQREGRRKREGVAALEQQLQANRDSIAAIEKANPQLTSTEPVPFTWEFSAIRSRHEQFKRNVDDLQREIKRYDSPFTKFVDNVLLSSDGASGYILHASMVSDTAHAIVSRVNLQPDKSWKLAWSAHLPGIFHDYSAADQAGAFETVYSKGNPEFDYQWAGTDGHVLALIMQLHMLGIDLQTGKILWNREL